MGIGRGEGKEYNSGTSSTYQRDLTLREGREERERGKVHNHYLLTSCVVPFFSVDHSCLPLEDNNNVQYQQQL